MQDYHIPLYPEKTYHILSHAVGSEKLFIEPANYHFFLQRFEKHCSPITETICYCLLPNHFHLLVRFKSWETIQNYYKEIKQKDSKSDIIPDFITERFSNFLNSYTKSFNKRFKRRGALFIDYLRRIEVTTDAQFNSTIFYIHRNPVHHNYCQKIEDWPWSSFKLITGCKTTFLCQEEVIDWFGNKERYLAFHQQPIYLKNAALLEV